MIEEWRAITNFPRYQVSSEGRVRSDKCILKMFRFKKNSPYLAVDLMKDGNRSRRAVHQLVIEEFVGNRPNGMEVRHLDGKADNNKATNLVWGTKSQNQQDRIKHGTDARGEKNKRAKLSREQVLDIRKRRLEGESASEIHKDYPFICKEYIYRLTYKRVWKWM